MDMDYHYQIKLSVATEMYMGPRLGALTPMSMPGTKLLLNLSFLTLKFWEDLVLPPEVRQQYQTNITGYGWDWQPPIYLNRPYNLIYILIYYISVYALKLRPYLSVLFFYISVVRHFWRREIRVFTPILIVQKFSKNSSNRALIESHPLSICPK